MLYNAYTVVVVVSGYTVVKVVTDGNKKNVI